MVTVYWFSICTQVTGDMSPLGGLICGLIYGQLNDTERRIGLLIRRQFCRMIPDLAEELSKTRTLGDGNDPSAQSSAYICIVSRIHLKRYCYSLNTSGSWKFQISILVLMHCLLSQSG